MTESGLTGVDHEKKADSGHFLDTCCITEEKFRSYLSRKQSFSALIVGHCEAHCGSV